MYHDDQFIDSIASGYSIQHFDASDLSSQMENIINRMESSDIVANIRSMGEILFNWSDLATHISINDISFWNYEWENTSSGERTRPATYQ